jgi:hypothetical protein
MVQKTEFGAGRPRLARPSAGDMRPGSAFSARVGLALRAVRVKAGLTLKQVVDRSRGTLGLTELCNMETGRRTHLSLERVLAVCCAIDRPLADVLRAARLREAVEEMGFSPDTARRVMEGLP